MMDLKTMAEMQTKIMENVFKSTENMPNYFKEMFGDATNLYKTTWMTKDNTSSIYENNVKFNEAYARYHQAVADMMNAAIKNIELIKETVNN